MKTYELIQISTLPTFEQNKVISIHNTLKEAINAKQLITPLFRKHYKIETVLN